MEDSIEKLKKRERSVSYPSSSLEVAIADTSMLNNNLGKGPFSRDSAAKALGYGGVNGKSASRIATCVHFGLLVRANSSYSISELAERIIKSISEEERHSALIEAVKYPVLYSKLIENFDEKAIPQMLPNILARNYGIADRAADSAAQVFRESVEYAGILKNGILSTSPKIPQQLTEQSNATAIEEKTIDIASNMPTLPNQSKFKIRSIEESGDDWTLEVTFKYSSQMSREIRKSINQLFEAADSVVDKLEGIICETEERNEKL